MQTARIQIHRQHRRVELSESRIRRIVSAVVSTERRSVPGSVSIVFVGDDAIRDLNRRFLGKDRPTDVIAFPLGGPRGPWGEIYVGVERIRCQAKEYGVSPEQEIARCIVHGVLHLFGYTDGNPRKRSEMRKKEDQILVAAGWMQKGGKTRRAGKKNIEEKSRKSKKKVLFL
jgi:rRNA maturation RNase YbeY